MARGNPLESLDYIFDLSEEIASDPKLRAAYIVMVEKMRREAEKLPMNTVQQLLIERIAFSYVVMKQKEKGELGGFPHATAQKDFYNTWLSMTTEFNKMLRAFENQRQEKTFETMRDIIGEVLSSVQDDKLRDNLLGKLADEFEKAGY